MEKYYQLSPEEVRMKVNGKLEPLTDEEVLKHQEQYGKMNWWKERRKVLFRFS